MIVANRQQYSTSITSPGMDRGMRIDVLERRVISIPPGMSVIARPGASVVLIWVMVCGPILPPEHVHRAGIEGRETPLAHAHSLESFAPAGSDTSIAQSHDDHNLALFLTSVYDIASRKVAPQPVMMVEAGPAAVMHLQAVHGAEAASTQTTHGPPRPAWLTRGPPSLC